MATGAEEDGAHAEQSGRDHVVVEAVADHDARGRLDGQVLAGPQEVPHVGLAEAVMLAHLAVGEVAADAQLIQRGDGRRRLVGGDAQLQAAAVEAWEDRGDALAQLERGALGAAFLVACGDAPGKW